LDGTAGSSSAKAQSRNASDSGTSKQGGLNPEQGESRYEEGEWRTVNNRKGKSKEGAGQAAVSRNAEINLVTPTRASQASTGPRFQQQEGAGGEDTLREGQAHAVASAVLETYQHTQNGDMDWVAGEGGNNSTEKANLDSAMAEGAGQPSPLAFQGFRSSGLAPAAHQAIDQTKEEQQTDGLSFGVSDRNVIFEGTNARAAILVHKQEYNEELGGEDLEAAREMQVVAEVAQPRRAFDLNGEAPVSTSNAITVSLGEASATALPPQFFILARREGVVVRSGCSTPRTPSRNPFANTGTTYSGPIPDHLATAIHEWLRRRGALHCNGGFVTPKPKS
jgi:hypothetical protein